MPPSIHRLSIARPSIIHNTTLHYLQSLPSPLPQYDLNIARPSSTIVHHQLARTPNIFLGIHDLFLRLEETRHSSSGGGIHDALVVLETQLHRMLEILVLREWKAQHFVQVRLLL